MLKCDYSLYVIHSSIRILLLPLQRLKKKEQELLLDTRESMMITNASVLSHIWMLQVRNALVMNSLKMNGTTATQSNL